jgi:hypothetical protein
MSEKIEPRNKALVLEAFDTLFNKRDYVAAERYCLTTFNTALISHLVGKVCSISSRAFRQRSSMSQERSWLRETS